MNAVSPIRGSPIGKERKTDVSIGSSEIGGTTIFSRMLTVHSESTGTSLVQVGCSEGSRPIHEEYGTESNPLNMNWVLVDDTKGNHPAQMRWVIDR